MADVSPGVPGPGWACPSTSSSLQRTITASGSDPAGRLTDVTVDGTLLAYYQYDANGSRLRVTRPGTGTVTGTYDAQDRVTSYGAVSYTYTANGDLQTATSGGQTTTYSYDVFGNLTAVSLPNGGRVSRRADFGREGRGSG